jgi:hypothetical protein
MNAAALDLGGVRKKYQDCLFNGGGDLGYESGIRVV